MREATEGINGVPPREAMRGPAKAGDKVEVWSNAGAVHAGEEEFVNADNAEMGAVAESIAALCPGGGESAKIKEES